MGWRLGKTNCPLYKKTSMKILILLMLFLISTNALGIESNYCKDSKAQQEWQILVDKYPADMSIQALHALRLDRCIKIDFGHLTTDQAVTIFENMRKAVISHAIEQ